MAKVRPGECQVLQQEVEETASSADAQPSMHSSLHKATPNLFLKYPHFPSNPCVLFRCTPFHLSLPCSLSLVETGGPASLCSSSIWCRNDYMAYGGEGGGLPAATGTLPSVPPATPKLSYLVSYCSCWVSLNKPPLIWCRWDQGNGILRVEMFPGALA